MPVESLFLPVSGAVTGALIGAAWLIYNSQQDRMGINVFYLTVSPSMAELGILWAVGVAFLGGILPSLRAARRPVAEALRAT